MSEKRKDNKGRVLRDGETYRKDGRYMYRYTDIKGQRCCINAHSLNELCEQEKQIQLHLDEGVSYSSGAITVSPIREIRPSDAKAFCIKLHNNEKNCSAVSAVREVLKPAFEMAADDEIVRRNPFMFRVADVVPNDER